MAKKASSKLIPPQLKFEPSENIEDDGQDFQKQYQSVTPQLPFPPSRPQVPVFPVKKSPSFVKAVKRLSIVEKSNFLNQSSSKKSQFSSTQENSDQSKNNVKLPLPYATKSVLLFDFSKTPENSNADKQILCLIYQFKNKPEGIAKRELECTIIKNLINQKKNFQGDQFMLAVDWASQYTNYLYENNSQRPSEISNHSLFQDPSKNIFRKDIVNNREFVVVNDIVWIFLKEEYSGGPDALYESFLSQTLKSTAVTSTPEKCKLDTPPQPSTDRSKSQDTPVISKLPEIAKKVISYDLPTVGLKNEFQYCYMHSGLQCLLSISDMNCFFLKILKQYQKDINNKKLLRLLSITQAYQELVETIRISDGKEYIKVGTLRTLASKQFNPRQQHDSAEFVLYLLSSIQEEINAFFREVQRVEPNQVKLINCFNAIDQLFQGKITNCLICSHCGNHSKSQEPYFTLSLALSRATTLEQCLQEFFREEKIKDYRCEKCLKKTTAIKKTTVASQPKNLIFHLKRFKFFPKAYKLSQQIQFPLENLSLNEYTQCTHHSFFRYSDSKQNKQLYKLKGVVVHTGNLEAGHYVGFSKRNHQWYLFNDQVVKRVSRKEVVQQQAYLLIYQMMEQ